MSKYIKYGNHYGENADGFMKTIVNSTHYSYIRIDLAGWNERFPDLHWKYCDESTYKGLILHNSEAPMGCMSRNDGYLLFEEGWAFMDKVKFIYPQCNWFAVDMSDDSDDAETKAYILTNNDVLFVGQVLQVYYDKEAVKKLSVITYDAPSKPTTELN